HWRIEDDDHRQRQADEEAVAHHRQVSFVHHAVPGMSIMCAMIMMRRVLVLRGVLLVNFAAAIVRIMSGVVGSRFDYVVLMPLVCRYMRLCGGVVVVMLVVRTAF